MHCPEHCSLTTNETDLRSTTYVGLCYGDVTGHLTQNTSFKCRPMYRLTSSRLNVILSWRSLNCHENLLTSPSVYSVFDPCQPSVTVETFSSHLSPSPSVTAAAAGRGEGERSRLGQSWVNMKQRDRAVGVPGSVSICLCLLA